ncbi:MAG TPA: alpha/beta hydrolase [Chloroflexota bacterium]|nr:alpha/beta hydrolase [Chloroflexota bacterium]
MTAGEPIRMGQIEANGMTMAYRESGAGLPVIFLHGAMVSGWMWDRVVALLGGQYRAIIPDLRGHGFSDNPSGELSYPLFAADVAAFVAALRLDAPVLVGWSMGGFVAIEVSVRHPGTAGALVAGGVASAIPAEADAAIRELYAIDVRGAVDLERFARERPELVAMMEQSHGPSRWQTLLRQYAAMDDTYRLPEGGQQIWTAAQLGQIEEPVLIMAADRDEFITLEGAVDTFRHLRHGELAVLPGATHLAPWERPEIVAAVLTDYLRRVT